MLRPRRPRCARSRTCSFWRSSSRCSRAAGADRAARAARQTVGVEEIKPGIVVVSSVSSTCTRRRSATRSSCSMPARIPTESRSTRAGLAARGARRHQRRLLHPRPRRPHRGRGGLPSVQIRLGAGDLALAEGRSPPRRFAASCSGTGMGFPAVTGDRSVDRRRDHRSRRRATGPNGQRRQRRQRGKDDKKVKAFPIPGHTPGRTRSSTTACLFVGDAMIFKQGRLDPADQAVRCAPGREQGRHPRAEEADRKRGDRHRSALATAAARPRASAATSSST